MKKTLYHIHSIYSQHGDMEVESIIKKAISFNIETIGISEHVPFPSSTEGRLKDLKELDEYLELMINMKDKYKDQINILTGIEMEPRDYNGVLITDWLKEICKDKRIDYRILGHHHYSDGGTIFENVAIKEVAEQYIKDLRFMFEEFDILHLAHPDGIISGAGEYSDVILYMFESIIDISIEHGKVLELNIKGFSKDRPLKYPDPVFWDMASKKGATGMIEFDMHFEKNWTEENYQKMLEFAKQHNVKLVEKII